MFKPLNNRLLVRPDPIDNTTASGIIVATSKEEKACTGVVLQGNTVVSSDQRIVFSAFGWDEVTIDGELLYLVSDTALLGIF